MPAILHISISVDSGDTGNRKQQEFRVHNRGLMNAAILAWLGTAVTELDAEEAASLGSERQIIT